MYQSIEKSLKKVDETLSFKELFDTLENDQSYLCAEFRPTFPKKVELILHSLSEVDRTLLLDAFDDYWIALLQLYLEYKNV